QGHGVCAGGGEVAGDHDALAGGQAVVLDHPGGAEPGQGGVQPGRVVHHLGGGGGHAGGGHHAFRERFGACDPGGLGGRAEAGDPGRAYRVGGAGDQRPLGADHHQVGLPLGGEGGDRGGIGGLDAVGLGEGGGAGIA